MRKVFVFIVVWLAVFSIATSVSAQNPLPTGEFDLCGKRPGVPPVNQTEYDNCYRCLYDAANVPRKDFQWSVIGCLPTSAGGLTQVILDSSTTIIGGVGFIIFLMGGFKILTSGGDAEKLRSGKVLVTSSVLAVVIVFFAVFIFRFVAENVIKLPGVGG